MIKNKFNFIVELLEQKKITFQQKERILILAVQELKAEESKDEEILKRISDIENMLKKTNEEPVGPVPPSLAKDSPKYINPSGLSSFLSAYNQDSILKGTCHLIDQDELEKINSECGTEQFDLLKYKKLIGERFNQLAKTHKISSKIYALIEAYLEGGAKWSNEQIELCWASSDLMKWAENNPGKVPNPDESFRNETGFELPKPFKSILRGERINSFSKLVYHFKYLFHIRSDNSLLRFIELNNEVKQLNDKIEFEISPDNFHENLELFTDVDKLMQAYNKIMKILLEVKESNNLPKPKVKLSFKSQSSTTQLSIHHRNSVYKKSIENALERLGSSQQNLIDNQINGLCDLYIKADFGNNQYAEINLWNGLPRRAIKLSSCEGVEYILIFKK